MTVIDVQMTKFIFVIALIALFGMFSFVAWIDGEGWRAAFFLVTMRWIAIEFI